MTRLLLLALLLAAGPALAQERGAAARQAAIDQVLAQLKAATSETEAAALEAKLHQALVQGATPAVLLLLARGDRELAARQYPEAEEDFSDAVTLEPDLAEAYDARAMARLGQGRLAQAVLDLQETVKRQPGDVFAWQHLALAAELRRNWPAAYAAWQRVMALDPKTPGGEARLRELRRKAVGENT